MLSPAFLPRYGAQVGTNADNFAVGLEDGKDSLPALRSQVAAAYAGKTVPGVEAGNDAQPLEDSIALISTALLIFAAVVAVAGTT